MRAKGGTVWPHPNIACMLTYTVDHLWVKPALDSAILCKDQHAKGMGMDTSYLCDTTEGNRKLHIAQVAECLIKGNNV